MHRLSIAILTACLATAATAQTPGGTPNRTDIPGPGGPPPINDATHDVPRPGNMVISGSSDELFLKTMANGGLAEVELGKLASVRAKNPDVKKFGQTMVTDHSQTNEKLQSLADIRKVELPKAPDAEKKAEKAKLETQSGAAFDAAYADAMVKAHKKTVTLLEDQIKNGKDATVRHFAQETLPTVKHHLHMAEELQAKVSRTAEPRAAR